MRPRPEAVIAVLCVLGPIAFMLWRQTHAPYSMFTLNTIPASRVAECFGLTPNAR